MKNYIPLVLAVLLGLAAVFAVSRVLSARRAAEEETCSVVAASRDIGAGEDVTADAIMRKVIPVSARPFQAVAWAKAAMIQGQKALRPVAAGDYVLLSDIGLSRSMANVVGEGEWAVTLHVGGTGIARFIQPGDDVAIIGTFQIERPVETADLSAEAEKQTKQITVVLFPRVRVLDLAGEAGGGEEGGLRGTGELLLALPPPQAQVLIAAQREAVELTVALRRPNDETALNRLDAGMVDRATFESLMTGLKTVTVPAVLSKGDAAAAKP
jgi:Flp pilus assembly protein CpaB